MANTQMAVLGVVMVLFVFFVFVGVWASRYKKVGPNQVLIVSGRLRQLPDGTRVGYRMVKGGGTFVFPIYETADALSLEVMRVEMARAKVNTINGPAIVDCVAQVNIEGDDASIVSAMKHFLGKNPAEIKSVITPVLEKHLNAVLSKGELQAIERNPAKYAADVEAAIKEDLGKLGLAVISLGLGNVRAA
jgi:flotillin